MKFNWVLFTAFRYIFKGRSNSPVLAILGITTGVLALIVIIAVMNGFQLGFIESILEISSYHIRIEDYNREEQDFLQEKVLSVSGTKASVPFMEYQAIVRGNRPDLQAVIIRGLGEDAFNIDSGMASRLVFERGSFDIKEPGTVLIAGELARRLGVLPGDEVKIFSITGIFSNEDDETALNSYKVTGIFRTGYYEYDTGLCFLNINDPSFAANDCKLSIGIKLNNRFHDRYIQENIKNNLLQDERFKDIEIKSWRDYNRSFFGALRTEKLFMFILVGLIFIVVGLNIYQAERRSVLQRREEIGLLRAIGGTENAVKIIFICDGAFIGLIGALAGLIGGISIALNIQQFFTVIENIVNGIRRAINSLIGYFGTGWQDQFSVFSPSVFYLKEVPSRLIFHEVLIIFLFGFVSALTAALFASRKIIKIQPAEILRYDT